MPSFSLTRERKILLAGSAVLLVIGVVYNLYPRISAWMPQDDLLPLQQDKLVRYRQKIGEKANLVKNRQTIERRLRLAEAGLLDAKTPALAAVEIQKRLQSLASRHGAQVKTMRQQSAAAKPEDTPYRTVAVEVTLAASVDQLVGMMHAIETSKKVQRIREMTLRAAGRSAKGGILATLTIEGFMKKEM